MRVALGQITAGPDKQENLEKIAGLIPEAARAGARLAVFAECAMVYFSDPSAPLAREAEPLDGPFASRLSKLARENGLAVVCGMYEPAGEERVSNTVVVFGPDGGLLGAYRKIHLYDAFAYRESKQVRPGHGELVGFELDSMRLGVMTCYDLRFPELARLLVDRGAQAIVMRTTPTISRSLQFTCAMVSLTDQPPGGPGSSIRSSGMPASRVPLASARMELLQEERPVHAA